MTTRPLLLDLYSGAGGAAKGYHDAGFRVVGADIAPQPNYPFAFRQIDALEYLRELLIYRPPGLRVIHASPPCQAHSDLQKQNKRSYPDLIAPTRDMLRRLGLPYVIENVEGAPLLDPIRLCGASSQFPELRVIRHRLFESNIPLIGTPCPPVHPLVFTHDKRKNHHGLLDQDTSYVQVTGGGNCTIANKRSSMGVPWMTGDEANEAIPPAYTRFIGSQLLAHVREPEPAM